MPIAGTARAGCALLALVAQSLPASAADKLGQAWPTAVQARYSLSYNGIGVGRVTLNANIGAGTYTASSSAKVSVLFGAFSWSGASNVSGTVDNGAPAPATYAFNYRQNKKGGTIRMGFKDRIATEIAVTPPPRQKPDTVPLTPASTIGSLDPMSAVLMLIKADDRPPCDRRLNIFDGKHRYDIVLSPKRLTRLPPISGRGPAETADVCRVMYVPVAGHRNNEDTKAYASNRDAELVLRRLPGGMLIPHSLTIPTAWGTGSMVTERIDIVTENAGKIAFTN